MKYLLKPKVTNQNMKRRITKIISFGVGILVCLSLFWLISIYSDVYPNSYNIHIWTPSFYTSYGYFFGHNRNCKEIYWGVDAQAEIELRATLRQYYIKKWKQEPEPGGQFATPTNYVSWDSYSIFNWTGKRYSVSAFKDIVYPESEAKPFKYHVKTKIFFCSIGK